MTTWSVLPFDNSRAADWVYALSETSDLSLVGLALDRLEDQEITSLDQGTVCEAIAACEVVARVMGERKDNSELTDLVDHWIAYQSIAANPDLTARARAVVARVLDHVPGLSDLWETISPEEWRAALSALDDRLAIQD